MLAPTLTRADPRELSSDELMHFVTYMEKVYLIFLAPDPFRAEVESVRNARSLSRSRKISVKAGNNIIKAGEQGDFFYIVDKVSRPRLEHQMHE